MEGCQTDFQIKYAVEGNKMSASCVPCRGRDCWKRCESSIVDSVESAKKLKSCQVINGSLEIRLKPTSNAMKELEKSLSDIIEIEDYLKISRSPCITSLRFFKNLKIIRGKNLANDKHSVVVFDNANLKNLFKEDQEVRVSNGNLFFHFNPKLCFSKIEKISNASGMIENYEQAKISNGASCDSSLGISTQVVSVAINDALIHWSPVMLDKENSVLSYVIYYKETETKNVEGEDETDVCGNDE